MKKITFLMLHLNYGGIEKQVTTLANNLCDNYEIEIISLYNLLKGKSFYKLDSKINVKYLLDFGPNKKEIIASLKKIRLIAFFKELIKSVNILYKKYFGIKKVVNNLNTDIVISSRIEFSKQIKRDDIITIAQEHSYINTKKYQKKVKKSFKGIKYLVVMTKKAKEKYDEWLKNEKIKPEVVVIPNIINENKEKVLSSLDYNQIISVGRLEDVKDFGTLIDIFYEIQKTNNKVTLKIIGDGSKRKELEDKVKQLRILEKVTFTGRLEEEKINQELLNSDVFVLTSKSESFSLVLCEAMNYGLPCVSFDIDVGPREIIQDNINGYLIENRNINEMIKKLEKLLSNKEIRKEFGINAFKNANRFYYNNVKPLWENIMK